MLEDVLKEYGGYEVGAMEVYTDIFRLGDGLIQRNGEKADGSFKANPVGYYRNGRGRSAKGHFRVFFDDDFEKTLHELQEADFAIMNGLSYFGRKNLQAHASKMYAMIFDLDGVTDVTLNRFLHAAYSKEFYYYPLPNYIILSGNNLHLYYVFEYPIPLYPNIKLQLKEFKYALTTKMWNMYTSTDEKPQFQGINQGFRPIGGRTKIKGVRVRAFKMHDRPFCLEMLGRYIPEEHRIDESKLFRETKYTLAEAQKLFPEWYQKRVVEKIPRGRWTVKRDLYDWWKRKMLTGATYHHRYFNIMCLAIYGAKCGLDYEEVEKDALAFIPHMNEIKSDDAFTESDVYSALECFDEKYCTFPRSDMEKISGILIPANKRNGRTQEKHLQGARAIRDINNENWRKGNGRKPKADIVAEWRKAHPDGKKIDCERETGLSRHTVLKWWNSAI